MGIRDLIISDSAKKQFAMALPKHLTPDRFVRVALTAFNKTPKLLNCTKESLLACLLDCSQLGLEPDGRKAHLIPYGDVCTLIIDYKGLVALARRSREISDIHADVVCEGDKFEYSFGSEGKLIHKPTLSKRGPVIAVYSFVKLKDGAVSYEVMSVDEVNAIKKRSRAAASGPWVTDWNEMAKKTVFRRHSKWLPLSSEFQEAIEKDFDLPSDIIDRSKLADPERGSLADLKPGNAAEHTPPGQPLVNEARQKLEADLLAYEKALTKAVFWKIMGDSGFASPQDMTDLDIKAVMEKCAARLKA